MPGDRPENGLRAARFELYCKARRSLKGACAVEEKARAGAGAELPGPLDAAARCRGPKAAEISPSENAPGCGRKRARAGRRQRASAVARGFYAARAATRGLNSGTGIRLRPPVEDMPDPRKEQEREDNEEGVHD